MPTSTDLVTDLPADFEVFGQAVDTRLKALQPGTTLGDLAYSSATANTNTRLPIGTNGQVLAVSSGVPTWTTTADVTPLTTKGDLFTFTTVDARLGVGANNTLLIADSAEATGIKWAGAWTTWTPTFTNFTLGNGTVTARYQQVGKTVNFSIIVTLGSTSSMGTTPYFTLPVTAASAGNFPMQMADSGSSNYLGSLDCSTTLAYLTATVTSGAYATIQYAAATQPFTWSTNDNFACRGSYEAA